MPRKSRFRRLVEGILPKEIYVGTQPIVRVCGLSGVWWDLPLDVTRRYALRILRKYGYKKEGYFWVRR